MILYRLIYKIVMLLLKVLHGAHPKVSKGYELRQKINGVYPWLNFPKHTEPLWFHCASGEFEYAIPLIRKIKEKNPAQKILVTYFTPSYLPRLEKEKLVDYVCPAPWDERGVLLDFIAHHKPKALLIARTDVWPEMTAQAYRLKIPTILFSMTFNKRLNPLSYLFYSWQLRFIDRFFVVAEDDINKLSRLIPPERIVVAGDTRYEQCLYRLQQNADIKIDTSALSKKVFVAGSLWPEDENPLIELIEKQKNKAHWILVPHEIHPSSLKDLQERLTLIGLKVSVSSQIQRWDGEGVLIVDEFGVLAHLYKIADFAFIGGSFKKRVHSVMEALANGCLTFVGPHYHNSREAEEFSKLKTGFPLSPVQPVNTSNFENHFLDGLQNWQPANAQHLRALFRDRAHATEKMISHLKI